MLKQSPGWAIASLVAAFVAGGLVGWGVSTRVGHGRWRGGPGEFGGGPPFGPRGVHSFLKRELDLTPAQEDSVRAERMRSEEHTSELQSRFDLVCRLLLEKKKKKIINNRP